jgi:hypothetical protein
VRKVGVDVFKTLVNESNEAQGEVLDHLLAFDAPKGPWRIQRPKDGQFYAVDVRGDRAWTPDAEKALPLPTEDSARRIIAINQYSQAGKRAMRGCVPVQIPQPCEPGDLVACSCGEVHEGDYCPAANGHGLAQ